jgi:dihydroflavonol-4-reductase
LSDDAAPKPRKRAPRRPKVEATSKASPARQPPKAPKPAPTPQPTEPPRRRRIWVSGANGFVGGAVARLLLSRGEEVTTPVRDARRAGHLTDLGATVVEDDLSDVRALTESLRDIDAVVHAAGRYRVGIARSERGAMWDANVGTTTRVLDAAEAAGTARIVYISTVNVFGNTHGRIVDETYRRDLREGFTSWYDETKYGAHEVAEQRIRDGAPIVIVMPSQVYGPGDHSAIGEQLMLAHQGKLPYRALDEVGLAMVRVDDLAAGIVAALDRGTIGQSYVIAGQCLRLGEAIALAAGIGARKPPVLRMPTGLLRLLRPVGRLGGQANLDEVIRSAAGVTYWATADKAIAELGFASRPFGEGLREFLAPGSIDA